MLSTRHSFPTQWHMQTESKEMEMKINGNGNEKKAGVAILTLDKTDFKIKTAARNKDTE